MALVTVTYGIKFALRAEELAQQQLLNSTGDLNITYFSRLDNASINVSMMSFEVKESDALNKSYFKLEQLATRRFGEAFNARYTRTYVWMHTQTHIHIHTHTHTHT
jgi:hypothetical protein